MPLKALFLIVIVSLLAFRLAFLPRLSLKDGQKIKVTGVISEEPQVSGNVQKFKLGQIEVTAQRWPEFSYGQKVEIIGKVEVKEYKVYNDYKIYNIYSLSFPGIKVVEESKTTGIKKLAIELRIKLRQVFNKIFSQPYDGIVSGIVIGDKSLISKDFYNNLKLTGTLHILVASGMNIAMFSEGMLSFFCLLFKRRISILLLILLIWFYSLITGFQPPIVRAAVMASLLYLGQFFGRKTDGARILIATGIIMVFINPLLFFDIGFQLSFMATAGLVFVQPKIKNVGAGFIPARKGRADMQSAPTNIIQKYIFQNDNFTSSISAQIATLPILFSAFGGFNLLSPLINLMVLWTIAYILQAGAFVGIIGIFGIIGLQIAKVASYPLLPLLYYLEQVIDWSAKISFLRLSIVKFPWWAALVYYTIIIVWLRRGKEYRTKHEL